ncbi:hypothetical protein [Streptomyces chattanoogensis]|uniref:Uncharacterized protein n=1 Tax=Streptomyces chattanoogensis TaxID=66876 RepID=A0A0N0H1N6_9ACTN|nr:hypothetical protein [Streptomyces chattanoogensis]KPC64380.1 hypothetical protein ADL29_12830 [Streptomyces chattanoogensis]
MGRTAAVIGTPSYSSFIFNSYPDQWSPGGWTFKIFRDGQDVTTWWVYRTITYDTRTALVSVDARLHGTEPPNLTLQVAPSGNDIYPGFALKPEEHRRMVGLAEDRFGGREIHLGLLYEIQPGLNKPKPSKPVYAQFETAVLPLGH